MTGKNKENQDRMKEQPATYDTYAAMPDDGNRYEIVDGTLELMSPGPSPTHQTISTELVFLLKQTCKSEYMIYHAPLDVILSQIDVRQPDIAMVQRNRLSIVTGRGIEGPPDLVVEVLSPGSRKRDKIGKMHTYARYAVPEYWIVDPAARLLEQYDLQGDNFALRNLFEEDDCVTSDKLPCVQFRVSDLFVDVRDIPV